MYAGNNIRHIDSQLCRELNDDYSYYEYRLRHNANLTIYEDVQSVFVPSAILPFRVRLVNAQYKTIIETSPFHSYMVQQIICMPITCTMDDLMQVMSYANVSHLRNNLIMKDTELIDIRILKESYEFYHDSAFYWLV